MKRLLCIAFVLLLMGCAGAQVGGQKWTVTQRVITSDGAGKVLLIEETQVPYKPWSFWKWATETGLKAGGL